MPSLVIKHHLWLCFTLTLSWTPRVCYGRTHTKFIFLKAILCCAWPCILTGRTVRAQCSLRTASSCIYLQKKKTTLCVCVCVTHNIFVQKSLYNIFLFSFFFAPNYMKIIIIWFFSWVKNTLFSPAFCDSGSI